MFLKTLCSHFQSCSDTQTYIHAASHSGAEFASFAVAALVSVPQNLLHHLLGLLKNH